MPQVPSETASAPTGFTEWAIYLGPESNEVLWMLDGDDSWELRTALLDAKADQLWMVAEEHLDDVFRLCDREPETKREHYLARLCCCLVTQDVWRRKMNRLRTDDGDGPLTVDI